MRALLAAVLLLAGLAACKQPGTPQSVPTSLPALQPIPAAHKAKPTPLPTVAPTRVPTLAPTVAPTDVPTVAPLPTPPPTATPIDPPPYGSGAASCNSGTGYASNCGGTPQPTPTPTPPPTTPTVPPAVAAYAPTYIYEGTGGGGGGGNDCSGSPCITGATFKAIGVRYAEGDYSGTFGVDSTNVCNGGLNCMGVFYIKMDNQVCDAAARTNIYNYLAPLSGDPAYLHLTSPKTASSRTGQADSVGTSSSCTVQGPSPLPTPPVRGVYMNPADAIDNEHAITTYWNTATTGNGGLGSNKNVCSRWDNSTLVNSTYEYGNSAYSVLQTWVRDYFTVFASFTGYPECFNALGSGGGNLVNGNFSGTHLGFACSNFICNDVDDICAKNPGTFKVLQAERPLISGNYPKSIYLERNLPMMLDTASAIYNDAGCAGVDLVELEPSADGTGDNRYFRDTMKAVSLLMQPGDYDGSAGHRAHLLQRYPDCPGGSSSCINQVSVFPEDNLNAFIVNGGMTRFSTNASCAASCAATVSDGNGCGPSDSGGAKTYIVLCDSAHNDDQGAHGAVYGRPFEAYLNGVHLGHAYVLVNQSNSNEPIQNAWCSVVTPYGTWPACNAYGHYLYYQGSGPQNCQGDVGFGSGCAGGTQICPNANGCTGAFGQNAWSTSTVLPGMGSTAYTLGACPGPLDNGGTGGSPTVLANDCSVILLP